MFAYLIGPLPFCVPLADDVSAVGPGTPFPLEPPDLDAFSKLVWRVRTWRCEISGLQNAFASYDDYSFDFANHETTGSAPPGGIVDLVTGPPLNIEHEYEVQDNFAQTNAFRIRITGLDGGRRLEDPRRLFVEFSLDVVLLLPGNSPPEEIAIRTLAGTQVAGTLELNSIATEIYTGFDGQITDTWVGNVTIFPVDEWSFEP